MLATLRKQIPGKKQTSFKQVNR